MGIIKRQGLKSTIVHFLGAFIGVFANLYIYTGNDEIYGYAQFLYSTSTLLIPFATFGTLSLVVKFFPDFEKSDSETYNGFLSLLSLSILGFFTLFSFLFFFFKDSVYNFLGYLRMKSELLNGSEYILLAITFFLIVSSFFTFQSANKLRIVVPTVLNDLGFKIFLPLLVLTYAYFGISREVFGFGIALFYLGISVFLFFYLKSINGLRFGKIKKPNSNFSFVEMIKYAVFGSLNQLGNKLAFKVDAIMVALFLTSDDVSFYIKAFLFTSLIEMPLRAFNQIASPIMSKAWANNNLQELKKVYQKTSVNLFVTGCFLFLGLWYCLGDLVNISSDPSKYPHVKTIFLLIGLSKLMDMATSVNNLIISYSRFYKFNLVFLIFLGISNVLMNYYFIPEYNIVGAAIATSASIFVYNLIKLLFIIYKFKMQPFTSSTIKTLILFLTVFGLYFVIPFNFSPLINIILKSIFVATIYLPIAYFWNISKEINNLVLETKNIITSRL